MSSRFPDRAHVRPGLFAVGACVIVGAAVLTVHRARVASADPAPELAVCSDPNNLPFSNARREGFENKLAELIARDLGMRVRYTWWAQRRGFVRNTLNEGLCDVVMGIPASFERTAVTRPYYRSTYAFVYRRDAGIRVRSFDDPILRTLRLGVQMVGDDYANTPPAHALANRGIIGNVRGYTVYGDYREANPPARIIEAVARGEIDVAIAWGPLAGYFATRQGVPLEVVPVSPQVDLPFLPFVYDIAIGVRRGNDSLRTRLDDVLARRRADIARLLDEYGVPRAGAAPMAAATPVT
jgi:mxaJ protein